MNSTSNPASLVTSSQELLMRDPNEFPESLKMVLDLITLNEVPRVVGSAAFLAHRYPSDVDVFEQITVKLSREEALDFYADQFKNIMQRIMVNSKDIKYNDFKAGIDSRFDIDVPDNSTSEQRSNAVIGLVKEFDLSSKVLSNLFQSSNDINKYRQEIYNLKILRWTPQEIIQGYKSLIGDKIVTLKEALSMNAIVKLDVIAWVSGRFQSIEAFYNLKYNDPSTGSVIDFHPLGNYVQGLLQDIEKYSAREHYSPLKVAKRMWSLSRVVQCTDLTDALTPLLQSDVAALNQIISDAEVLQSLIKKDLTNKQAMQIFSEILTFHKRAANHLFGDTYKDFEQLIDLAFPLWICRDMGNRLSNLLNEIHNILRPVINSRSEEFLQQVERLNITCRNPRFQDIQSLPISSVYSQV